jgi:glycosyltransferase involved in cell wall biosynthesis
MAGSLGLHRMAGTFFKTIDRLVVPDSFLKIKMLEGGFPEDRIVIIRNPFDLSGYEPNSEHDDYILFVGRLVREKGIFTLLEAMKNNRRVRLLIVGDGPERESVQRTIRQNDLHHVVFVGPRYGEDLKKLLSRAWFVIFPSEWYDNGPMVIYQSFAMGKPVVASQIDGIPELVIENETGLLFPPGDSTSLAIRIERLVSDEQTTRRLGRQARRFAEERLGSEVYLNALNSLLQSLTGPVHGEGT